MRQLDADLRRFFARRIVRGAIVLALLIAVIAVTIPTIRGHAPRSGGTVRQFQVGTTPDGNPVYSSSDGSRGDSRIAVGKSLADTLQGVSIVLVFVGVVLGASFVGAEFHLGSLTSQLLYEPRRWRVHLSKAATVGAGCAAFAVLLSIFLGALIFAGSELHGVVQGIDASWWSHRGVQVGRAAACCGAAAVMAYAVTVVTHRTSAAIVVFLVMYPLVAIIHPDAPVFGPLSRYAPIRGLVTLAFDPRTVSQSNELALRTNAGAITLTVVWIVVLVAASGAIFSRAEVR